MNRYPTFEQVMDMTGQDMFDHAAGHLLTQYRRSTRPNSRACLYRDAMGGACGVGALIPDALYCDAMEQRQATDLIRFCRSLGGPHAALADKLFRHVVMLKAIQHTHDELDPSQWRAALSRIARAHDLDEAILALFPPRERDLFDTHAEALAMDECAEVTPVFIATLPASPEARRQYERMLAALKDAPPFVGIATERVTCEFA